MDWCGTGGNEIAVNAPTEDALLADLALRLDAGKGFSVATLNLDHVVKLKRDPAFRAAYAAQTHVTADGNPIVWLSHMAGDDAVRLVPGSEVIDPVAALAAGKGAPLGLFGSSAASLDRAGAALKGRHEGLEIAFSEAPAMGFDPDGEVAAAAIARIGESGAQVVFLALGAPRQERFAARAQDALPGVGFLSIGAGLDFISGAQVRAPAWVRRAKAEWLWRLMGNPRRLAGRYGAGFAALPGLMRRARQARGRAM